jgi:UDP-N-acetylmuramoyl-L-alanyl-D-glutamate--2,6-diaminopimelate ligase
MMPGLVRYAPWELAALLADFVDVAGLPPCPLAGISLDSRSLQPGELFLACAGSRGHGMEYAADAVRHGAAAIAAEPAGGWSPAELQRAARELGVPVLAVPELARRASALAGRFYGQPADHLRLIGVTGTNGKTSVSQYLAQALAPQRRCGVLGTVGYGFPGALLPASHTTPDAVRLQALLAELHAAGADSVAMEVSSHALHQHRVAAVPFDTALFTNLSRDHLDYHGDMAAYAEAKAQLFRGAGLRLAVLNTDDAMGRRLAAELRGRVTVVACGAAVDTDALGDRFVALQDIATHPDGLAFGYRSSWGAGEVRTALLGRFNAANLALVLGVLLADGLDPAAAGQRLAALQAVPGRMEAFGGGAAPLVVVDYAHTPDALAQALGSLRGHTERRLHCVFGCGGDRDRGKRPQMGAVAERLADRVTLTDDNPRGEGGDDIIAEIRAGMRDPGHAQVQRNRALAIRQAVAAAAPGDVVLVAGKGHEDYQLVGELRLPFSDAAQVRQALRELQA